MRRLVGDELRGETMYAALACGQPEVAFEGKELALLEYARKLTADVGAMCEADMARLREAGADDGEILEVNQVCALLQLLQSPAERTGRDHQGGCGRILPAVGRRRMKLADG